MRILALVILMGVSPLAHAKEPANAPKATAPQHFSFDDDVVESGLDRALDAPIGSVPPARHVSLIRIRRNFVPEMLRSCDGI